MTRQPGKAERDIAVAEDVALDTAYRIVGVPIELGVWEMMTHFGLPPRIKTDDAKQRSHTMSARTFMSRCALQLWHRFFHKECLSEEKKMFQCG
jgi:hypothetical protein